MTKRTDWKGRLDQVVDSIASKGTLRAGYARANADLVQRALEGIGVDGGKKHQGAGIRVVVNMSSAHITSFCKGSGYKNAYDLEADPKIGRKSKVSEKRKIVDAALHAVTGCEPRHLYFAAVELNGTGIGFYGDLWLVLREQEGDRDLTVLDRNSYDLIREPLWTDIKANSPPDEARANKAASISGRFGDDLSAIAAIKVLESRPSTDRLLSTGMVSTGVLEDEDYIEVLRTKSFGPLQIEEVRMSAADVAVDERIRSRGVSGLPPSHAELLWRRRRRVAEARLSEQGIPVRAVTTTGRSRG